MGGENKQKLNYVTCLVRINKSQFVRLHDWHRMERGCEKDEDIEYNGTTPFSR